MGSERNYRNCSRRCWLSDSRHRRRKRRYRAARNPERRDATATQRVKADDSAGSIRRLSIARALLVAMIVSATMLVFMLVIAAASGLAMIIRRAARSGIGGGGAVVCGER